MSKLWHSIEELFDLFFPPLCQLCDAPASPSADRAVCASCHATIQGMASPRCQRCALPFATIAGKDHLCGHCLSSPPSFDCTIAAGLYETRLREAIHRFKYDGTIALDRPLAALLHTCWQTAGLSWSPDLIVPVPLHPERLKSRTYNQALLLARELGRLSGVPVSQKTLQRIKITRPQIGLTPKERVANLAGAFMGSSSLEGADILLVDDVMTTGATAQACAKALKDKGAGKVAVAVLARARRDPPQASAPTDPEPTLD